MKNVEMLLVDRKNSGWCLTRVSQIIKYRYTYRKGGNMEMRHWKRDGVASCAGERCRCLRASER